VRDVASLEITQVRSLIGAKANQRATVRSLGLRRVRHTVVQPDRPEIRGMVAKVAHLVEVRYAGADEAIDLQPGQEPKGEGVPPAGHAVHDEDAAELRRAEADALAEPGSAPGASLVQHAPGLTTTDAPDAPEPVPDASDNAPSLGVESASDLPHAVTDAPRPEPEETPEAGAVPEEALADPRGDLDEAVAAGDLPAGQAEEFRQEQT
jgi:large subunit ribosomal protein L30